MENRSLSLRGRHAAQRANNPIFPVSQRVGATARCLLPLACMLLSACAAAPLKQEPFQQYLEAVQLVAQGADDVISREYKQELAAFEKKFATGEETDITRLLLEPDPSNPFSMSYPTPPGEHRLVFLAIADQHRKLQAVNKLAIQYASLLVRIVGAETGKYDVEAQAKALNNEASKYLSGDQSALISSVFVTAAKQYIENKRRDQLSVLLGEGQSVIDAYASLGGSVAKTAASTLSRAYDQQFTDVVRKQKTDIKGVLALNDRTLEQLEVLRKLDQSYIALVDNHARLKVAIDSGDTISFDALIEQAKSLKELYSKLK